MSDKETKKNKTEAPEKVMTKYDRKMQRRREEKEREKKEKKINTIITVVVIAALVILAASFPIRRYIATHETYVTIGGEEITRPEFDYNYNLAVNNYTSQYGDYLSYFGLDTSRDLSTQMYTDTMTWKDFFEEMAVESITNSKALKAQADAAGFTYDAAEELEEFEKSVKENASAAGLSVRDYLRQLYGSYATMKNVTSYMENTLRESAYYQQVMDEKAPSDEEIQAYYEENKASYDSVDYYQTIFKAELPTEPTELADPVEEDDEAADAGAEEKAYEPSEAEIAKAMEDAKKLADGADAKAGELRENIKRSNAAYFISDWLYDEARKEGDTTVIEDTTGHQYYVLSFVKRYLDETPTADLRVIITQDVDGQTILDEWKAGAATEESFKELHKKYSADAAYSTNDGLLEGVTAAGVEDVLVDWIFAEERAAGDVTSIVTESGYTYVMYYVGAGNPEWKNSIKTTLQNETMTAYMEEISADIAVEDKKNRLNYLKIRAQEEAAAAENDAPENTDGEAGSDQAE